MGKLTTTGILLTNLGTPDAPTAKAVRRYLAEFLSDERVIRLPKLLWYLILYGIILPVRPHRTAKLYQAIWTEKGSPLLVISQQQAEKLQLYLQQQFNVSIKVVIGMRYGRPSIHHALQQLRKAEIEQLWVLPLYPQYSMSTTASSFDAIAKSLSHWPMLPKLHYMNHYANHPAYIQAIANSIQQYWKQQARGQCLLFSFHGLPKRSIEQGDPYYQQCLTTAKLIAQQLQLEGQSWRVSFQSRFGPSEWLQPYTDKTLIEMPKQGIHSVDVICPGFASDCLETLEEIAITNRDIFLTAGGQQYHYIPALNASPQHIELLATLLTSHCKPD